MSKLLAVFLAVLGCCIANNDAAEPWSLVWVGVPPFVAKLPFNTFALPQNGYTQSMPREVARTHRSSRGRSQYFGGVFTGDARLVCPSKLRINVLRASFGNVDGREDDPTWMKGSCHDPVSTVIARRECNGRTSCALGKKNYMNNPCTFVGTRMAVTYACQHNVAAPNKIVADAEGHPVIFDTSAEANPMAPLLSPPYLSFSGASAECPSDTIISQVPNVHSSEDAQALCETVSSCAFVVLQGRTATVCAATEAWREHQSTPTANLLVRPQVLEIPSAYVLANQAGRCAQPISTLTSTVASIVEAAMTCQRLPTCVAFTIDFTHRRPSPAKLSAVFTADFCGRLPSLTAREGNVVGMLKSQSQPSSV